MKIILNQIKFKTRNNNKIILIIWILFTIKLVKLVVIAISFFRITSIIFFSLKLILNKKILIEQNVYSQPFITLILGYKQKKIINILKIVLINYSFLFFTNFSIKSIIISIDFYNILKMYPIRKKNIIKEFIDIEFQQLDLKFAFKNECVINIKNMEIKIVHTYNE